VSSARFVAPRDMTIAEVLASLREPAAAVSDGRVFLGRTRVTRGEEVVRAGLEVLVHAARDEVALPEPFVLQDRDGFLVVDKPAGIPSIPDTTGARGTLVELAARATNRSRDDLHPTSRLDREVSGVVTFAIGERARDLLATAREAGRYTRRYVAIARGELPDGPLAWKWSIGRARDPRLRAVSTARDAKPADTRARVVARSGAFLLLAVGPQTGRTHQIRLHAATAGAPLVGDRAYGGATRLTLPSGKSMAIARIALHCARVEVYAGPGDCIISATSPVPPELVGLARDLGLGDFEEAVACEV
jgi:23S rRNA-/tRNA-specific pseudouridylate synthase